MIKNLQKLLENWNGQKVLMTVFPHPDDETMVSGGLLLVAKRLGWKTVVVTLTHGEAGQIHVSPQGKTLKQIRAEELKNAAAILGVHKIILGSFSDGKLRDEKDKWISWLKAEIRKHSPSLVVTYDHSGLTGHPDHIVLSVELKKILATIRTKPTLFWTTLPTQLHTLPMIHPHVVNFISKPTHLLDLGWKWINKWQAAKSHRSQKLGKELPIPLLIALFKYHVEWYHEVNLQKQYPHKFVQFKI